MKGKILIVGFGPGSAEHLTFRARQAVEEADVVVGYTTYIGLIRELLSGKEVIMTGMQEEVQRARMAVDKAEDGHTVAVVSSGDAGIYGMAGLIFEVLHERDWHPGEGIDVEVVPGVTALCAVGALLGAPIMHDFASISLSDHLTPWPVIAKRIEAAADADFVIVLYNPKSGRRTQQIVETRDILLRYRSPFTPVGIVKSAYREGQKVVITDLGGMLEHEIGMLTTIVVGNKSTKRFDKLMVTPRGYQRKYVLA